MRTHRLTQDASAIGIKPRGYVQRLEARVAAMEALLARICPAADLSREIDALLEHVDGPDVGESDLSDDEGAGDLDEDEDEDEGEEDPEEDGGDGAPLSMSGSVSILTMDLSGGGRSLGRAKSMHRPMSETVKPIIMMGDRRPIRSDTRLVRKVTKQAAPYLGRGQGRQAQRERGERHA